MHTTNSYCFLHITATVKFPARYAPKLTFIIVKKRHHARLFPMSPNEADKSGNCVAGTVVDSVITHPTEFDFCKILFFEGHYFVCTDATCQCA
jgi:hypothetical protein